jgi:hypothetical protein
MIRPSCGNCFWLSVTEEEQNEILRKTGFRPPHFCKKYRERLFHAGFFTVILEKRLLTRHGPLTMSDECIKAEKAAYDT